MKKSLVMAMAMAMGVTASAYAANPFSDVPAGHWAYDAVAQLAAAGVVDGYGTTFGGEKLMTRYEMAQIVAKAMAKGGNCDKLAAEFADELDALGVRVAKLEKKVDNVKITGQIRYSYAGYGGDKNFAGANQYNRFRTRLFVNGQINDSWSYTGMLENDRMLNTQVDKDGKTYRDGNTISLKRAWLTGRLGGVKLRAGRVYFVQNDMIDANADGVEAKYSFGKVNLTGWAARSVDGALSYSIADDNERLYMAKVDTKFGKLGAMVEYWKLHCDSGFGAGGKIWELGLDYSFTKDWKLAGQWYRGDVNEDGGINDYSKNGWEATVKYAGAKAAKPGTWGAWLTYSNRPWATYIKPTTLGTYAYKSADWSAILGEDGYQGYELGANWAMAKNIVLTGRFYDLKGREGNKTKVKTYWADVVFSF